MGIEESKRLDALSNRMSSVLKGMKSGEIKLTDSHKKSIDDLDSIVEKYENILENETK